MGVDGGAGTAAFQVGKQGFLHLVITFMRHVRRDHRG